MSSSTEMMPEQEDPRIPHSVLTTPYALVLGVGAFWVWVLGLLQTLALTGTLTWAMGPGALGMGLGLAVPLAVIYLSQAGQRGCLPEDRIWPLVPLVTPIWLLVVREPQPWQGAVLLTGSVSMSVGLLLGWRALRSRRGRWMGFALAVLLPFALYLVDLSPYVGKADTFEFQVVAPTLGVAHPSGYPLYTLIGKLFSMIPVGTMAWRVNLSSAVFAALASGVLFWALTERVEVDGPRAVFSGWGALVAAWALAFSPTLWSRAIEAEVYALNACLVALALWLAVRWRWDHTVTSYALPAFGLLIGVALASHVTLGALFFLALVMLLTVRSRIRVRTLLIAGGLGLLGLALYLYIPIRWPAVTGGERMSLGHFWRFVTNAESGGALRPSAFIDDPGRWKLVGSLLKRQAGLPGLLLAGVGLVVLTLQAWNLALGTLLAFAAWVWFNISFYVADPDYSAFLIPAHVILFFWLGTGVQVVLKKLSRRSLSLAVIAVVAVAVRPMWQVWTTGPTLDTRTEGYADEMWGRYVLQQPLVAGSAILADSEKFPPLYYLQQIEGLRSDLELVTLFNESQYRAALSDRLTKGQVVYLARYLPGLDAYGVGAMGPLVRVAPDAPGGGGRQTTKAQWDRTLSLVSSRIEPDPFGRRMHHLHLTWRADVAIDRDLVVKVRLVDPETGTLLWMGEGRRPVSGYTNTQTWKQDTVVSDYVPLDWPDWVPPGAYRLDIGVFQRFGPGLPLDRGSEPWFEVGLPEIPLSAGPASFNGGTPKDAQFLPQGLYAGEVWLGDVDLPGEVTVSSRATLNATWSCETQDPPGEPWLRWVSRENGQVMGTHTLHPIGYETPAAFCGIGTRVPVRYEIPLPGRPGTYQVEIGWGTGRLARCRWLGRRRDVCRVGSVDVLVKDEGLANYDRKISLLDADIDAQDVPAGGALRVTLRWRALRRMTEDYTVFVQVVGPDGQLYGQADSWPVQGARPTSGWEAGEELRDSYQIYVDTDGPSGDYRVIVGWYLLADMGRLPVLDAQGREVGDYVVIGSFNLP